MTYNEFVKSRRSYIGASDAPVIMGVSKWSTPYKLWLDKLGMGEEKDNFAMQRGREKEEAALQHFSLMTGYIVKPRLFYHNDYSFLAANPDGATDDNKVIVEVKLANKEDHALVKTGVVPAHYYPQVQHQISCCNSEESYYVSLYVNAEGKEDAVIIKVERDDSYIKDMIEKMVEFWGLVQTATPPPNTNKDHVFRDEKEWALNADLVKEAEENEKHWKSVKEKAKQNLIDMSNKQSCYGSGVKLTRSFAKGTVDYKAIPELKNIDLDQYRKEPIEKWTLTIEK